MEHQEKLLKLNNPKLDNKVVANEIEKHLLSPIINLPDLIDRSIVSEDYGIKPVKFRKLSIIEDSIEFQSKEQKLFQYNFSGNAELVMSMNPSIVECIESVTFAGKAGLIENNGRWVVYTISITSLRKR